MKCVGKSDDVYYAVKVYPRHHQSDTEIAVLKKAANKRLKGVVHLVEVIIDSKWTYLIMELIDGVNLLEYLSTISLSGETVYNTFNALWKIVKQVHSLKYEHGRICFKNFYYLRNKEFRLIGFTHAKPIEQIYHGYIDYWSIGVCLYTVLCGHPPFDIFSNDLPTISKRIVDGEINTDSEQFSALSKKTKFLIELLCSSKPFCSSEQLMCLQDSSFPSINNSKQQIDENENIVSIRAVKVHTYQEIETSLELEPPFNGFEASINGNGPIESRIHIVEESPNANGNTNGLVEKVKKPRGRPVKKESIEVLPAFEIKKERLRKRPQVKYDSLNGKNETQPPAPKIRKSELKESKIKNPTSRKKQPPKESASLKSKATNTPAVMEQTHSPTPKNPTLPPKSSLKTKPKDGIKTKPKVVHQSTQTDLPAPWVYQRSSNVVPSLKPYYCFERYNYME